MAESSTPLSPNPPEVKEAVWALNVPPFEKLLLLALADLVPLDGTQFKMPTPTLMAMANVSYKTMTRAFREMKDKGLLACHGQVKSDAGRFYGSVYSTNLGAELPDRKGGFVYLIQCGSLYKIGRSFDPQKRIYQMTSSLGDHAPELTLLHAIKTDDAFALELTLHHRYRFKRREGEWFALNEEQAREVMAMK